MTLWMVVGLMPRSRKGIKYGNAMAPAPPPCAVAAAGAAR